MKRSDRIAAKPARTLAEYYYQVQQFNAARVSERWVEKALNRQATKETK